MRKVQAQQYKEFEVGQKWTDAISSMEILKILIPHYSNNVLPSFDEKQIAIYYELTCPSKNLETIETNAESFRNFINQYRHKIKLINPKKTNQEITEQPLSVFNRFQRIED